MAHASERIVASLFHLQVTLKSRNLLRYTAARIRLDDGPAARFTNVLRLTIE
ncbi:unnamed protein product, partial [Nesidiocoris tenuis]